MKTSEVLDKAADVIQERGWTVGEGWQDIATPRDQPLCVEGALQAAAGYVRMGGRFEMSRKCPAYAAVMSYLNSTEPLFCWNDSLDWVLPSNRNGRSQEETKAAAQQHVIEVLRATAVIEAAREQQAAEVSA